MALTVLPSQRTIGEAFGQGFESSIGNALNLLTQYKLKDIMKQREKPNTLQALQALGFNPQEAEAFYNLTPSVKPVALKYMMKKSTTAQRKLLDIDRLLSKGEPEFLQKEAVIPPQPLQQNKPYGQVIQRYNGRKKLSTNIIDALLRKAGNDPKKARELALYYGYEV